MFRILMIALIFVMSSFSYAAEKDLCVLIFDKRQQPITINTQRIFKNSINTKVVVEASPKDLKACVSENYREIILVIHAMQMDETRSHVNLGYFSELQGEARSNFLARNILLLETEIQGLKNSSPLKRREITKLEKNLVEIQNIPQEIPLYGTPQIIFNRFFEGIEKDLIEQKERGELRLQKLRLMSCAKELIFNRYPLFGNLEQLGIEFDAAPASRLWSRVKGKSVTQFNARWLRQSVRR